MKLSKSSLLTLLGKLSIIQGNFSISVASGIGPNNVEIILVSVVTERKNYIMKGFHPFMD